VNKNPQKQLFEPCGSYLNARAILQNISQLTSMRLNKSRGLVLRPKNYSVASLVQDPPPTPLLKPESVLLSTSLLYIYIESPNINNLGDRIDGKRVVKEFGVASGSSCQARTFFHDVWCMKNLNVNIIF
jgi:hypothetical protein